MALNREAWLEAAVQNLRPLFLGQGFTVPEIRVSVGWPSKGALSPKKLVVGQCWFGSTAADGKPQLFISPLLDDVIEPTGVLATLVHEVSHVIAGPDAKHGPQFAKVAKKIGLEGKMTSTNAGEDLIVRFKGIQEALGPFPHSKIIPCPKDPKPQTTRMRKCECETCGFLVRLTQKWLDVGQPICPGPGHGPMKSDLPTGEEGE